MNNNLFENNITSGIYNVLRLFTFFCKKNYCKRCYLKKTKNQFYIGVKAVDSRYKYTIINKKLGLVKAEDEKTVYNLEKKK